MSSPAAAAGGVDPAYEFDCPRYRDFREADDEQADNWFGADADGPEEATEEVFNNTSMLTMPIAGMDIQEDEAPAAEEQQQQQQEAAEPVVQEEAAAEPVETVEAPEIVAAIESAAESTVEPVAAAAAEQAEEAAIAEEEAVVAPVVVEAAPAAEIVAEVAVVESESESAQPEEMKEVQAEEENEAEISAIESDNIDAAGEDTLIEATLSSDSLNGSLNNDACIGASRGSLVFASLRSSLPMLAPDALASASESIVQKHEEHRATDEEVEALQQSMLEAEAEALAAHTPELVEAQAQAEQEAELELEQPEAEVEMVATAPLFDQPESADIAAPLDADLEDSMEDHETAQRLADQFAAVADTPRVGRTPSKNVLPSARRATTAVAASNAAVPSFLRPTAAAAAKARQTMHVATPSHVTTSRGNSLTRSAAKQAAATAATPKPTKKRAASQAHLEELARPRTALKARNDSEDFTRPTTASKAKQGQFFPKLTVAQSPALCTRARARKDANVLSSEEEELRRIAAEREEVARTLKRHAALHEQLANAPHADVTAMPMRSAATLTHPEEFTFHTAKRAKTGLGAADLNAAPAKDATAAAGAKKDADGVPSITKPQPFSFHTSQRTRRETIVLSREEAELAEIAAIKPFKALPLRESVLTSGGQMGVPRIQKAKLTEAISPQLSTAARCKRKQDGPEEAAAVGAPSSAAPVDGANKSAKKPRREVQPFHLATEERGRKAADEFRARQEAEQAKAQAAHIFTARPVHLQATPRAPAASPSSSGAATARAAAAGAAAEPRCVELHKESRARWEAQVAEAEQAAREARQFKARPNPFAGAAAAPAESFVPAVKSDRRLTVAHTPVLASEERAARRAQWEQEQAAREAELKELTAACASEREQRDQRDLAAMRRSMKPATVALNKQILDAPTFVPKPSTAKLTQPESPMLVTKRRAATLRRMDMLQEEEEQENNAQMANANTQVEAEAEQHEVQKQQSDAVAEETASAAVEEITA